VAEAQLNAKITTLCAVITELDVTGLFIAIGHDPRTELFTVQLGLDESGYLKAASPSTRTNIPACSAREMSWTTPTGGQSPLRAAAALDAERYLAPSPTP
jgi:thioredoxin reductase (NADPH)